MKFEDHVQLVAHTKRLTDAAAATLACYRSLQDGEHSFEYAGQRFIGRDALVLKEALLAGLNRISVSATAALVGAGIEMPEPDAELGDGEQ